MEETWKSMIALYREMGMSEEEIKKRILCKTTRVIDGTMELDKCDIKDKKRKKMEKDKVM